MKGQTQISVWVQRGGSRNRRPQTDTGLSHSSQDNNTAEKMVFLRMALAQLDTSTQNPRICTQISHPNRNELKWTTDLNAKCATMKLLEDNTEKSEVALGLAMTL